MRQPRRSDQLEFALCALKLAGLSVGFWPLTVAAQDGAAAAVAGFRFQPRLSVSQTLTDNLRLSESGQDRALITTIAPGVVWSGRAGGVRGSLDYSLNGLFYTRAEQASRVQHNLVSSLTAELLSRRLYVDVRAMMGQQALSAFGAASADPALVDSNRKQTATLSISPYARGELGGLLSYDLRVDRALTRVKDSQVGDSSTQVLSLRLGPATSGARLGWSIGLTDSRQQPRYSAATSVETADLTFSYRADVDWLLSTNAGYQRSDVIATQAQTGAIYGAGITWTPTPRTRVAADARHQVFGDIHSLSVEHRLARTVWRLADSRTLTTGVVGSIGAQSNYELLYLQFASIEPDPVKRDVLVRQYLQSNGLSEGTAATGGFLTASTNLTRRQEASVAWLGRRTTATLTLSQSQSKRLGAQSAAIDDFSLSGLVVQRGYSLNLSHRLTPASTLSLGISQQHSRGDTAAQSSDMKSLLANWSIALARRSTVQLGVRHSQFDSATLRYRENALLATYVHQF